MPGYRCVGLSSLTDVTARVRSQIFRYSGRVANGTNSNRRPDGSLDLRLNNYLMMDFSVKAAGYNSNGAFEHCCSFSTWSYTAGKYKSIYRPGDYLTIPGSGRFSKSISWAPPRLTSNELNVLRSELQNHVTRTTMELAVSLKELPESIRMLLNAFQRLNNVYQAASRRDLQGMGDALGIPRGRSHRRRWVKHLQRSYNERRGAKDSINGLSGIYLEGVFGWWSAYNEIISTAEFMADLQNRIPRERAFAVTAPKRVHGYEFKPEYSNNIPFRGGTSYDITHFYRLSATYRVSWSTIVNAAGLNISAAWQIVPYSFIVNWFADVTSFLSQFELLNSLSELDCKLTVLTKARVSSNGTCESQPKAGGPFTITPVHFDFEGTRMERTNESLSITAPPLRLPNQVGQGISAIALIAQRITGR